MTGPVSVPIKYYLTARDLERIRHREELIGGLKTIVELTDLQVCVPRIAEAHKIAKRLLEKEQSE